MNGASLSISNINRASAANPMMDENFLKMKKSCERIAAVLGIREGSDGQPMTYTRRKPFGGDHSPRGGEEPADPSNVTHHPMASRPILNDAVP